MGSAGCPVDAFVILDDLTDMGKLSSRLISTEFETGLTMVHAPAGAGISEIERSEGRPVRRRITAALVSEAGSLCYPEAFHFVTGL